MSLATFSDPFAKTIRWYLGDGTIAIALY